MDHQEENVPPQTQGQISQVLVEFLEVAITSIVYLKGIYPSGAFERGRYLNLVVHRARHPQLRDYIHSAVSGLSSSIAKGLVERVAVIFSDSDDNPVERFIFKLSFNNQSCCESDTEEDAPNLEFSLRSLLIKLAMSGSLTKVVVNHDCRWGIMAYLRSLPEPGMMRKEASSWIPTMQSLLQEAPPIITPIKSMSSETFSVQLNLEHPSLISQ